MKKIKNIKVKIKKKGFTLLELILVISIMALLSAIIILPNFKVLNSVRKNVDSENKNILESAFKQYYIDHGQFPDNPTSTGLGYVAELKDGQEPFETLKDQQYVNELPTLKNKYANADVSWKITKEDNTNGIIEINAQ